MRKNLTTVSLGTFLLLAIAFSTAYGQGWNPGDPHKMHFPQLPDETGWDVNATNPVFLADDWECTQTGWVMDFHFWGSWKDDVVGVIGQFVINIHEDWPVGHPGNPNDYSMPGDILWQGEFPDFVVTPFDPPVEEGWYDPSTGEVIYNDHQAYFQYDILLPEVAWFWQEGGTIYWLSISAILSQPGPMWGWKSSIEQWNDDATWRIPGEIPWIDLYDPGYPYTPGDFNNSGLVDVLDIIDVTNYVQGAPPPGSAFEIAGFYPAADGDGDCDIDMDDVQAISDHIYQPGHPPLSWCPDYPPITADVSLDLAFVITGGEDHLGACCFEDAFCYDMVEPECNNAGGIWQGAGNLCLGDASPANGIDDACETAYPTGACCYGNDQCVVTSAFVCANNYSGTYKGDGTDCTDNNSNGVADICEQPTEPPEKLWEQLPNVGPSGMNVTANIHFIFPPTVLAGDFECEQYGPITEIVVWGSWYVDLYTNYHCNVIFTLSIHENVPGVPGQTFGHPGQILWSRSFNPGSYACEVYSSGVYADWYDPYTDSYGPDVSQFCYMYTFDIGDDPFIQEGSPTDPNIYWLDVQANLPGSGVPPDMMFGWRTSNNQWNDDATWATGIDEPGASLDWNELRYPTGHPSAGASIDLAFRIKGYGCDCRPGECDGGIPIDILDIVHLIDYKFKECPPGAGLGTCPPPTPYPVCSGDADCNCIVDILDIVRMIDWKFKECPPGAGIGTCPAPCSCAEWISMCSYPFYK